MKFIGLCYGINCTIGSLIGVVVFFASIVAMFYNFWLGLALFVGINIVMKICEKINVFLFYKRKNVDLPPILLSNFWIRLLRLCLAATFVCFILAQIYLFIFGVVIAVRAYNPQKKPIESIITRESNLTLRGVKTEFGVILAPDEYTKDYVRVDEKAEECLFSKNPICGYEFDEILSEGKNRPMQNLSREAEKLGYDLGAVKTNNGKIYFGKQDLGGSIITKDITPSFILSAKYSVREFGKLFDARYGKRWEWFIETVGMPSGIIYGLFYSILFAIAALQYLIFGRWSQEWLMKLDKGS